MIYVEVPRPGPGNYSDKDGWARIDHGFLDQQEAAKWADGVLRSCQLYRIVEHGGTILKYEKTS